MTDHLTRVREQAEREANENIGGHIAQAWFIEGAAWFASRLTREKIADAITNRPVGQSAADAILALVVEGEA